MAPGESLRDVRPDIAEQWHPYKNSSIKLNPSSVLPTSGRRVWWKCSRGNDHEWITDIYSRAISGIGCPFCANKRVSETNSLANLFPEIASEWHPTKNLPLTPDKVVAGTHKRVWWKCPRSEDHVYRNSVAHRTERGQGCPKCSRQTSLPELRIYSELKELFPETESRYKVDTVELDIFLPTFNLAIEYDGAFYHKGKTRKDIDKNQFATTRGIKLVRVREHPLQELGKADVMVREGSFSKSDMDAVLHALIAFEPKILTLSVSAYLDKPGFIADDAFNRYVSFLPSPFPEKSVAATHPELAATWCHESNYPLTPANFTSGSGKKVWWVCDVNSSHRWETTIAHRAAGKGCPFCAGQRVDETNSLAADAPDICAQWDWEKNQGTDPSTVAAGSGKKFWWKCTVCNHNWEAAPYTRTKGHGCPQCAKRKRSAPKIQPPEKQFANFAPHLLDEYDYQANGELQPKHLTRSSNKKVHWVCSRNNAHRWEATVHNRVKLGSGCPICYRERRKLRNEESRD